MSEKSNPAWELCRQLTEAIGSSTDKQEYPILRALLAWVPDVERRLPQLEKPPTPRSRDTTTAALERAGEALEAQYDAEHPRCPCIDAPAGACRPRCTWCVDNGWGDPAEGAQENAGFGQSALEGCKCGGTYQPRGDGMACDKCERYHRNAARPQSAWVVEEPAAPAPEESLPGPVEALRELLTESEHEPCRPHEIMWRVRRFERALRARRSHQIMVFRPAEVLP